MPIPCPTCGELAPDDARFCERDGTHLKPTLPEASAETKLPTPETSERTDTPPLPVLPISPTSLTAMTCRCGAGVDAREEGYCTACGRKWVLPRKPLPRDHMESGLSPLLAAVTDRGQRHLRNEDDFALSLSPDGDVVLVVCDGVSSSEEADRASAVAAKIMGERLREPATDRADALRQAVAAAHAAVCALGSDAPGATSDPPETTVVAATVHQGTATLGWVGDSRAYWIDGKDPAAARLLTHDHSWINEVVDAGEMTGEDAEKNRLAHAITRCLGATDVPDSSEPTLSTFALPATRGWLLLCTDGLWNYAPSPTQIAELIHAAPPTDDAVGIARTLVAWANAQGGRDNITVALLAVPGEESQSPPETQNSQSELEPINLEKENQ